MDTSKVPGAIAIIGMGCRYPGGAHNPEQLWDLVASKRDTWTEVPKDRYNGSAFFNPDPEYPEASSQNGGHFLNQGLEDFDPGFFGISAPEAEAIDPLQRIVLETAWEAVESAGVPLEKFRGSNTGVYMAMFGHDAEQLVHKDSLAFTRFEDYGITRPLLANRLSYLLDLHGASVMLDTACSGSLVAIHLACQSLRLGETSTALAGGVGLIFSPDQMALMSLVGVFNADGRSYTWDDRGNGYGRGEGVGIVMLKRLEDAIADGDPIRAVIRNTVVNQDGRTNGISLPSQTAQEQLARDVFYGLPFTSKDIQYAEAHGTGTRAGDKIEMQAIRSVLASNREEPLIVGAIKSNIGHSEAASGAAGLIRTVMSMERGLIAPQALLDRYKPGLEPEGWNITIPREMMPWPVTQNGLRRATVNSFGFGGTNAMLVLESASTTPLQQEASTATNGTFVRYDGSQSGMETPASPGHLFVISAKSSYSTSQAVDRLRSYLEKHKHKISLLSLSHTLATKRSHFPFRSAFVADSLDTLIQTLSLASATPQHPPTLARDKNPTVFIFTGQGAQWPKMGHSLILTNPVFRASIEASDDFLRTQLNTQWSLIAEISHDETASKLHDSRFGQPASTAIQLALVDLLNSWGITPAAVVGHSSGEIAAAYAAGVLSRHAAMTVSYQRSFLASLSRERVSQAGAMLAVGLGDEEVARYLTEYGDGRVVTACVNSPSSVTLSGDEDAMQKVENALQAAGVFNRRLKVDTAYHSHHMKAVAKDYQDRLAGLEETRVTIVANGAAAAGPCFFSTVTEEKKQNGFGPSYWVSNLESPVRFAGALQNMMREVSSTHRGTVVNIVEIGPHKALAGPVRQTLQQDQQQLQLQHTYIATLDRGKDSVMALLDTGARLYESGAAGLDVSIVASLGNSHSNSSSSPPTPLTTLPPYAWDHTTKYWSESRLSRDHRFRKHAYHPLVGSRVVASPDTQPSWRILLSHDRLGWLKDHMVDDVPVFPATGYISMAIQALSQVHENNNQGSKGVDSKGCYRLKGITLKRALNIPKSDGTARGQMVEVMLMFRHIEADDSFDFVVSSYQQGMAAGGDGRWFDHCTGNIRRQDEEAFDKDEQRARAHCFEAAKLACNINKAGDRHKVVILKHEELYRLLTAGGNYYGPAFAISKEMHIAEFQGINTIEIPKVAQQHDCATVIHPTILDAILQTALPVFIQHATPGSVMPTYIAEVTVSADANNHLTPSDHHHHPTLPGQQDQQQLVEVLCNLKDTYPRSTGFSVTAFHDNKCLVSISGEAVVVSDADTFSKPTTEPDLSSPAELAVQALARRDEEEKNFVWKSKWGLDIRSITADILESVVIPLQSDEANLTQADKVEMLDAIAAQYIDVAVREVETRVAAKNGGNGDDDSDIVAQDFRRHQWKSFLTHTRSKEWWQELLARTPSSATESTQFAGTAAPNHLGAEGEALHRIGPHLVDILTGKTDALALLLQDQLLFRIYHGDEGARASQYMADYAAHLTFQRPGLRILEVGAGTGGTTARVLRACFASNGASQGGKGASFCAEYMFTDISAGFFQSVKEGMLKPWANGGEEWLKFQALDLERDPVDQGFEEGGYDLIIAANVVHATARIRASLGRLRRLLKPGGKLGLVELTRSPVSGGMIFGCLEGWWAGVGEGRVKEGPVQNASEWDGHLRGSGFSGVDLVAYDLPEPARHSALMLSTAVVVENGDVVGARPIELLSVIPERSAHYTRYVEGMAEQLRHCHDGKQGDLMTLVTMGKWSDGATVQDDVSYVVLDWAEQRLITHATPEQLARVMYILSQATRVYWISLSSSSSSTNSNSNSIEPDNAMVTGLVRVAQSENAKLQCFTLDIQDTIALSAPTDISCDSCPVRNAVGQLIRTTEQHLSWGAPVEHELMLRNNLWHIQRFVSSPSLDRLVQDPSNDADKISHLHVAKPGLLSSMTFIETAEKEHHQQQQLLGDWEVEIRTHAHGVNFKDVLIALAQLHPRQTMVGEHAGVITRIGPIVGAEMPHLRPGDRVAAFATTSGEYYATLARTDARLVHKVPDAMSLVDAAAVPVAFGTASYALFDCAGLRKGMSVLVHAATGALGQAAVALALDADAVVYATAGTEEKRRLVHERFGIPMNRIFSSRSTAFTRGIVNATQGRGVDMVLNSLAGELLAAGWNQCMADLGCFVELGKVDIWKRATVSMEPFDRGVRFVAVDMGVLCKKQPEVVRNVLERVFDQVTRDSKPVRKVMIAATYPVREIEAAFRYMQAAKHVGKIVLKIRDDERDKALHGPPKLTSDGTYVVAGGLGAVGRTLCRHLQLCGARHVVLLTRRQFSNGERVAQQNALTADNDKAGTAADTVVRIITCDVSDIHAVRRASITIQQDTDLPPVKGVIQGALVLSDRTLNQLTRADFDATLAPRYYGTKNLWTAFIQDQPPLDFFLLLSSMSGIIGSLGQANYAATASYQDMFSHAVALNTRSTSSSFSLSTTTPAATKNVIALDIPLIRNTQDITAEHVETLRRQGGLSVDMTRALTFIDYAMSGRALQDGCHQILFGAHPGLARPQPLLSHALFGYQFEQEQREKQRALVEAQEQAGHDNPDGDNFKKVKKPQNIPKAIATAPTLDEAEALILMALRDKVASLTAVGMSDGGHGSEQYLDIPVADMGLDSLIATELKNWIFNTLSARVQNADIVDAPSLRVLAGQITSVSGLVSDKKKPGAEGDSSQGTSGMRLAEEEEEGSRSGSGSGSKEVVVLTPDTPDISIESDLGNGPEQLEEQLQQDLELPKYPVQPLHQVLHNFLEAASHLGTPEELEQTRRAIADFLAPGGIGQAMQARLEGSSGDDGSNVVEMYVRGKWLRTRTWRPRLRNFFGTIPGTLPISSGEIPSPMIQARRAATLSLAAYNYKLALDQGNVQQDFQHDQPLSMETVHWIFNTNRVPAIGCDRMDRWPGNNYICVMRRGHAYKVPLFVGEQNQEDSGAASSAMLSRAQLADTFQAILSHPAPKEQGVNWAPILTTAHRDEWARIRQDLLSSGSDSAAYLDCIEKSLFVVYLEEPDAPGPRTAAERAQTFLLDDNSNRWLDKTLGIIVCANGVAAGFLEHTMVDGTTFEGLAKALAKELQEEEAEEEEAQPALKTTATMASTTNPGFTYIPFSSLPASLTPLIATLREQHLACHTPYDLANYDLVAFGTSWLRQHRLPPKSAVQMIIQLAVHLVLGHNPLSAVDVVSQRPFAGGRTDMVYTAVGAVVRFCEAAAKRLITQSAALNQHQHDGGIAVLVPLFKDALRSHTKLLNLAQRGSSGWRWHLAALAESFIGDQENKGQQQLPALYRDAVYLRTSERRVATSFTEFGVPEMGRCPPEKGDVWFGVECFEEKVHFTVITGGEGQDGGAGVGDYVEKLEVAAGIVRELVIAAAE